nr:MAG TPA: hypothetical protein [Caudoviricetes sp.]
MFPQAVTVYNIIQEEDPSTLKEVTHIYITILRGVMLQASKGANVRQSGLEGADAANLYIPFTVEAVDGKTGAAKTYAKPQEFVKAADRSGLWTLSYDGNGGETLFIKGEFVFDGTNLNVVRYHDDCYNVTKVDAMDYGSPDMQHWEVGGA